MLILPFLIPTLFAGITVYMSVTTCVPVWCSKVTLCVCVNWTSTKILLPTFIAKQRVNYNNEKYVQNIGSGVRCQLGAVAGADLKL